jgi:hypothetical protein
MVISAACATPASITDAKAAVAIRFMAAILLEIGRAARAAVSDPMAQGKRARATLASAFSDAAPGNGLGRG